MLDDVVEELLGKLGVELLGRNAPLDHRPLSLNDGIGELPGRLVDPLLLMRIRPSPRRYSDPAALRSTTS